jgi:hypothetical protein
MILEWLAFKHRNPLQAIVVLFTAIVLVLDHIAFSA